VTRHCTALATTPVSGIILLSYKEYRVRGGIASMNCLKLEKMVEEEKRKEANSDVDSNAIHTESDET
jgi:hypothetical protein